MRFDTRSEPARAEHARYVRYVEGYLPRPADGASERRVLITGFGPFGEHGENATASLVRRIASDVDAPPERAGALGPIGTSRAIDTRIDLAGVGQTSLRGLVLPVAWDVAAAVALAEIDAFRPELVVMMGIARRTQPMVLELGAQNSAAKKPDASGILEPAEDGAPLVPGTSERVVPLLLHWAEARDAARGEWALRAAERPELGRVLTGIELGSPTRPSNRYLCNATAVTVGIGMGHSAPLRLLEPDVGGGGVDVPVPDGLREVPRVFVHLPSDLVGPLLDDALAIVLAAVGAELRATGAPAPGNPEGATYDADPADPLDLG
jgi:hypothetical protein